MKRILAAVLFLAVGLAVPALAGTSAQKTKGGAPSKSAATVEPAPPIALNVRLVNLQKNTSGGVATVSADTSSSVNLDEVTLNMSLPAGVVFADGTRTKTWTFSLAAGGTFNAPADLLAGADGKYVISVEATGSYQGKPVHRGHSFKLLVGVLEKGAQPKDGAIEYPGVPDGGA